MPSNEQEAKPIVPLGKIEFFGIFWLTCATWVAFYGPQPVLPAIQSHYGVSLQAASLVITLAIAPLAFAPLLYGKVLGARSAKSIILWALALCEATLFLPVLVDSFALLLFSRCVQGLTIPAIALALMTCIATRTTAQEVHGYMAVYATATMIGAYAGRILTGAVATLWGWKAIFIFFALLMLSALPFILRLRDSGQASFTSIKIAELRALLGQKEFFLALLVAPLCIFAYSSVQNFIPFRMKELSPDISELGISLMYISAFVCSFLGFASKWLTRVLGSELRIAAWGICFFLLGTPLVYFPHIGVFFVATLVLAIAFSLMYSTMPGVVNQVSKGDKSTTNALFLVFYYIASSTGSWLPLVFYNYAGLEVYLICVAAIFSLAMTACVLTGRALREQGGGAD